MTCPCWLTTTCFRADFPLRKEIKTSALLSQKKLAGRAANPMTVAVNSECAPSVHRRKMIAERVSTMAPIRASLPCVLRSQSLASWCTYPKGRLPARHVRAFFSLLLMPLLY